MEFCNFSCDQVKTKASMDEGTLNLAKKIASQSLEDDEAEARDGSPKPLRKNHASRLEAKLQGFR